MDWFPSRETTQVVGRVIEVEATDPIKSAEEKRPVFKLVPVMEHKVVVNSAEISHTRLKDWNRKEVCDRFPGAWDAYLKTKGGNVGAAEESRPALGLGIEHADFLPRAKIAWLKTIGFSTVEQLANMSDAEMQTLGTGARAWQKKAKQLLSKG